MKRIPEPELMDDAEQASAYAAADFRAPHERFVTLFNACFPRARIAGPVLDLGCGPGDVLIRFARRYTRAEVLGVDGAAAMLAEGRRRLRKEPLALRQRIRLKRGRLPHARLPVTHFPTIISNSLLHHLHDPLVLWQAVRHAAAPGARIFVVDLRRARSRMHAGQFRDRYAAEEPAVLQRDFYRSLLAAFTPDEVREQLRVAGLPGLKVRVVSDRHLMVWGRR